MNPNSKTNSRSKQVKQNQKPMVVPVVPATPSRRRQNPDFSKVESAIHDSAIALLSAKDLLLPRAMPTHVSRISTHLTVPINDCQAVQVQVRPDDLYSPVWVSRQIESGSPVVYTCAAGSYYLKTFDDEHLPFQTNVNSEIVFRDFYSPSNVQLLVNDNPDYGQVLAVDVYTLDGNREFNAGVRSAQSFLGPVSAFSITITFVHASNITTSTAGNLYLTGYDSKGVIVSNQLFGKTAGATSPEIIYGLTNAAGAVGESFTFRYIPTSQSVNSVIQIVMSTSTITINGYVTTLEKYKPISANQQSYWDNYLDSALKWSFTSCSVVLTNTAASITNGGTVASALFPSGSTIGQFPAATIDAISSLPYNNYNGQLREGAHVSYLADDISQYFFRAKTDPFDCPIPVVAAIAQQGTTDNILSMQLQVFCTFEIITSDLTRVLLISPGHTALFEAMVRSILVLSSRGGSFNLAGCNPDHLKRMWNIAKQVAKDPNVRSHATTALKSMGQAALKAAPLMLSLM